MPEKETLERAEEDKREGKAPSTQAGEFVKEEMDHIREGKHGAASTKQAIAIGLSKARRSGVDLPPPKKGRTSEKTRKSAESAYRKGQSSARKKKPSRKRSRATENALKRQPRKAASKKALSRQAKQAANRRGSAGAQEGCTKSSAHERCGGTETGGEESGSNADEAGGVGTVCGIPPLPTEGRDGAPENCGDSHKTERCGIPP